MTPATMQILEEALRLTPIQKAELIDKLFHSFDRSTDRRIDEAWSGEIESRIDAYENGNISADSAEAVLERVNQR
ncbi:MAG: addiction module protein [Candidatus Euphemobacter frigidus]|nr:addiction module protein [Candidatus Euphemobacter frigidus]MDP8276311.1 addiction module protein [Candidatus Euphemobacter frigidus]